MKTRLYGPMDHVKPPKLRFREGNLVLPEGRRRYASSRVEEEEDAQSFPCGNADDSGLDLVGGLELCKKDRTVAEEKTKKIDECDVEKFDLFDSTVCSENMIVILRIDGGHGRPNRKEIR